jgi:beta-glucanase (GH16 family)
LELKARKETHGGQEWTCGNVWTRELFHYGYFECRYTYAGATGTNNSFWLWPRNGVPAGEKAFELDINEGHYPNIVNTNIHNWTDKYPDGSHETDPERFVFGGIVPQSGYTHIFETPVTTNQIRFSSSHGSHFHIGEFRIYAPNAAGYPSNEVSETADTDVAGLVNYTRTSATTFEASGKYAPPDGRNTDPENVGDGSVTGYGKSWIAQAAGEKWLVVTLDTIKEIGCVQFTNGWWGSGQWNALINNYKLEYWDGEQWVEFAAFDIADGADFSEEYHTYGFLWTDTEFKFFFDGELFRSETHTLCHSETNIFLSLAILSAGIAGEVTDVIDGTSMKIDYVRYYKRDPVNAISDQVSKNFLVYPNPVKDQLYVSGKTDEYGFKVYTSQGQMILNSLHHKGESIQVSSLSEGMYIYVVESSEENDSGIFVKQ